MSKGVIIYSKLSSRFDSKAIEKSDDADYINSDELRSTSVSLEFSRIPSALLPEYFAINYYLEKWP